MSSPPQARVYGRGTGVPHPVDIEVGNRIRVRRLLLGMNQEALAQALGLTFQQIQKYENGVNRISASRLSAVAESLGVPVSYFFADLQADAAPGAAGQLVSQERIQSPELIELVRLYYAVPDDRVRQQFLRLLQRIAGTGGGGSAQVSLGTDGSC